MFIVYIYNGAYWKRLSKDDLKYSLGEAAIKFGYLEIYSRHHLFKEEPLKQFVTQAHLPAQEHDTDKVLINLQNGTFEFMNNKWKLKLFDQRIFNRPTYQLPFAYDTTAACPVFNSCIEKVLPDKESQLILQEFSGFIFTRLNLEKCLVLTGCGSNWYYYFTVCVGHTQCYPFHLYENVCISLSNIITEYV